MIPRFFRPELPAVLEVQCRDRVGIGFQPSRQWLSREYRTATEAIDFGVFGEHRDNDVTERSGTVLPDNSRVVMAGIPFSPSKLGHSTVEEEALAELRIQMGMASHKPSEEHRDELRDEHRDQLSEELVDGSIDRLFDDGNTDESRHQRAREQADEPSADEQD